MYKGMIFVKKSKYIAILLMIMLFFTSCGQNDGESDKKEDGMTLTLHMRVTESFNPLAVTHHSVRDVFSLCYEPLFTVNDKIETEGVLAQDIVVSDDCMTAVINLKDSVLWHDGVSFTSGDVVHTINLLKENPTWIYYDCVKYIETAESIDALSVRLKFTKPYGQVAHSLTFPIVSVRNTEIDTKIMGTGPYMYSNYVPATTLELVSNENWHGGDVSCGKVNVSIIRDDSAVTTAFNTGILSAVTDQSFDTENSTPLINIKTYSYPSAEYEYIVLNHRRSAFGSQAVRCAISFAIDRSAIVTDCYNGEAMEANTPVHPAAQDISESTIDSQYSLANASEMLFLEGYVLDENTRLLKDSGGNTLSFSLLVNEENLSRVKTAELLVKQLFAAGIDVKVISLPFEKYSERIAGGDYDAYLGGTRLLNFYDYEAMLSETGELNNYGYSSEYMQLALNSIGTSNGQDSLNDAVFNFEEVFLREQPVLGLVFKNRILMTAENVEGDIFPGINAPYKTLNNWTIK